MMLPIDVVVAAVAAVAEEVAPVVASTEVDVDFLVEVFVVDFLVVLVVDFFEEDFLVDFFVVFFTGINYELEALSAASFMALALLPAVHASTRAAIRITFFILLSILSYSYTKYLISIFTLSGAKFGIFWEITKRNPLFFSSSFPIFPIHPLFIISIPSNYPARFIDGWGCRWFIQMLIFVQKLVQMIHLFDLNQKRIIITPKISFCVPKCYQNVISLQC